MQKNWVFGVVKGDPKCSGQSFGDGVLEHFESSCKLFNIIYIKTTAKLVRIVSLSIENIA